MQQLTVEHKNPTSNQIVDEKILAKDRREGKGRVIALSRQVYRIQYSDVYYVESETADNIYYFVKFKPDVFEWCSCMDNSSRGIKCKHIFSIEFAIRMGTLKDIEKLPAEAKRYGTTAVVTAKSYRDEEDYSF